jgi:hypothetical protein
VVVSEGTLFGTGYMAQRPAQPPSASELEEAEMLPSQTATNYGGSEEGLQGRAAGRGRQ